MSKKNIALDATVLTALMSCPRLTHFRFNLRLQTIKGTSNSFECGQIVHKYMEVYYTCIKNGLPKVQAHAFGLASAELYIKGCSHCSDFTPTKCGCIKLVDEANQVYSNAKSECPNCQGKGITKPQCGHKPNEYPGVKNTPPESEGYQTGWKFVLETIQLYYDYYINDFYTPLEVERVMSKVIFEDDEIRVLWKAKIDLLTDTNQGIYPLDHKTMKQNRTTLSLNNQFMGQCIVTNANKVIINKVGFQKSLPPKDRFERAIIPYSTERLTEWVTETVPFYAKMLVMYEELGYFPPNYTNCQGKYGMCLFHEVCESNPLIREDELKRLFFVGPVWNPMNADDEV